ncbi:hypothetical protein Lsan_2782 [Legionella santicrucis]|uniref:Mevalonate kinase n=1 Tax=Legionella santicrucis TaxID=45074 RepID=A0A0W0YJ98_9GAMM|nr:hypothetical protein [Legionella santicrucis]KTD56622.1 hypothetical protein Lsan_2782 [Legionella santicrucis]
MKWLIPAKTFLLGEYAALAGASAILLTTSPCFELILTSESNKPSEIHPKSPAGIWWQQQHLDQGLIWNDPYAKRGGLGASSAQFLASYLASCFLKKKKPNLDDMLNAYYKVSWVGTGLKPSGYDVIAQAQDGCVYVNQQKKMIQSYGWPFQELSFFLIHTGVKLATHHHLQTTALPDQIDHLSALVDEAKLAFEQIDSTKLIATINNYHKKLVDLNLVAEHSLNLINRLKEYAEILAIKGCGALGSDVILIVTANHKVQILESRLKVHNCTILASEKNIYFTNQKLITLSHFC